MFVEPHDEGFARRPHRNATIRFWTVEIAFGARAVVCRQQTTISTDLDSAAQASIDETADSTLFLLETEYVADRLCEMPVFKRLRKIV
jgi:hypothetical protein